MSDEKQKPSHIDEDPIESHPMFQDEFEEMANEFFEQNDPDFAKFLKKMNGESED